MAEHGGRAHFGAVGAGEQVGGAQEDGGALLPGHGFPCGFGFQGGVDGQLHVVGVAFGVVAQQVAAFVRRAHGDPGF